MKNLLTKVKESFKSFTTESSEEKEIKFQVNKEEDAQLDTELNKAFVLAILVALVSIFVMPQTAEDSKSQYVTLPSPDVTCITTTACTEYSITKISTTSSTTSVITTTPVSTVSTTAETTPITTVIETAEIEEIITEESIYEEPVVVEEYIESVVTIENVDETPEETQQQEEIIEENIETEIIPSEEPQQMTYLGNLKITGYVATGNPTASGVYPYVGGVAMSRSYGLPWGTTIYIEGLGYYTLNDTGCSYGTVDVFCNSISECYDLTSWHDVYIVN